MASSAQVKDMLPSTKQIVEMRDAALQLLADAKSALADAIDAAYASGKFDTPQVIEARRKVANAAQAVTDAEDAIVRAQVRDEQAAADAQRERDEQRTVAARTLLPTILRLGTAMHAARGHSMEANTAFVNTTMRAYHLLPRKPDQATFEITRMTIVAQRDRWGGGASGSRHSKSFDEHMTRVLAWIFGLPVADVLAMADREVVAAAE